MSVFTFAIAMAKENRPPEKNSTYGTGDLYQNITPILPSLPRLTQLGAAYQDRNLVADGLKEKGRKKRKPAQTGTTARCFSFLFFRVKSTPKKIEIARPKSKHPKTLFFKKMKTKSKRAPKAKWKVFRDLQDYLADFLKKLQNFAKNDLKVAKIWKISAKFPDLCKKVMISAKIAD